MWEFVQGCSKTELKKKVPDKQEKHKEVNGLDAPKKSKMGDPLVFEKIVSWDLRVSDVRAGTFLSDYNLEDVNVGVDGRSWKRKIYWGQRAERPGFERIIHVLNLSRPTAVLKTKNNEANVFI